MAGAIEYEEQRRRMVEANRRKRDELRLDLLSAAVQEASPKPLPVLRSPPPPLLQSEPAIPTYNTFCNLLSNIGLKCLLVLEREQCTVNHWFQKIAYMFWVINLLRFSRMVVLMNQLPC